MIRGLSVRAARPHLALLAVLAMSRVAYWFLGVRFDASLVNWGQQLLDADILQHDLWRSIWYLHMQPPGFNLFVGIVLRLTGGGSAVAFQALYLAASAAMALMLLELLRGCGLHARTAFVLATLVMISPTVVQYENFLLYTHFERVAMVGLAYALQRWARSWRLAPLAAFAGLLALLALTRVLFQPIWVIGAAVVLGLTVVASHRRALLLALLPAFVVGAAVIAKNAVVFGSPTMSTMQGINLSHMSSTFMDRAERQALFRQGKISIESVSIAPCSDAPARYGHLGPRTDAPALDRFDRVKAPPYYSFNQRSVLGCERALTADSLWIIRHDPGLYLRTVNRALAIAYYPATPDIRTRPPNQHALRGPARVEALALGSVEPAMSPFSNGYSRWHVSREEWLVLLAAVVCLLALPWVAWRARQAGDPRTALSAAIAWLIIATTHIGTQLFDVGENARFRSTADPILLVGTVLVVVAVRDVRRLRAS